MMNQPFKLNLLSIATLATLLLASGCVSIPADHDVLPQRDLARRATRRQHQTGTRRLAAGAMVDALRRPAIEPLDDASH